MDRKLVSVVVPSYNHSRFIRACLESIVEQTYGPLEIVIVDDGSTDDSVAVIEAFVKEHSERKDRSFRTFFRTNHGAHRSINFGLQKARGEVLTILNSDDLFHRDRIEQLVRPIFTGRTECTMSLVEFIDGEGQKMLATDAKCAWYLPKIGLRHTMPSASLSLFLQPLQVTSGNLVFTRSLFERLGGFANYHWAHDYAFALRATLFTEPMIVSKKLMSYRYHGSNTVSSMHLESMRFEQEVRRILEDFIEESMRRYDDGTLANRFAPTPYSWPHQMRQLLLEQRPFFARQNFLTELTFLNDFVIGKPGPKNRAIELATRLRPYVMNAQEARSALAALPQFVHLNASYFDHEAHAKLKKFATPKLTTMCFDSQAIGTLIETDSSFAVDYDESLSVAAVFGDGRLVGILRFSRRINGRKSFRGFSVFDRATLQKMRLQICWLDFKGQRFVCRWPGRSPFENSKSKLRRKVAASGFLDQVHVGVDHVAIEGWAVIDGELPEKIELKVDDRRERTMPSFRSRPDLSSFLRNPHGQSYAGFYFMKPYLLKGSGKQPKVEIIAHYKGKALRLLPSPAITRERL